MYFNWGFNRDHSCRCAAVKQAAPKVDRRAVLGAFGLVTFEILSQASSASATALTEDFLTETRNLSQAMDKYMTLV